MGEVVLEPSIGGPSVQKRAKIISVLFVLLCGILLGWFIIIALSRGDVPAADIFLDANDASKFLGHPSSEPVSYPGLSAEEVVQKYLGQPAQTAPQNPGISAEEALEYLGQPAFNETPWQPTKAERRTYGI
jgi:hypothetical protein